jgi:hypothetical protein
MVLASYVVAVADDGACDAVLDAVLQNELG